MKSSKLPQKREHFFANYESSKKVGKRSDTDTTTVTNTIISSTHIFNQ